MKPKKNAEEPKPEPKVEEPKPSGKCSECGRDKRTSE